MIQKSKSISINNHQHNDKKKENVNNQLKFNFLTNRVKGLQSSEKRVKIIEYFNNKIGHRGTLLLQETHSSIDIEKQ